ncbi:complex I subunit 5 family protein [Actinomadura rupiterrae]|uniref:complex I subunit 5 family protein n=1 Tax=Actinomadura rupiterrae TaxID=559627 RepID=UPI0020A43243|nr:complex I subunit 5 family protein [Actinomadura rupiterrae]MCP2336313.1 multicomponent Na+:H+ antiporter subunit D [Actinomadura rupiterrae]
MSTAALLPMAVVLPLTAAALAPLLARLDRRLPLLAGLLALAGAGAVLLRALPDVLDGRPVGTRLGGQAGVIAIVFTADPLGTLFALVTALVGAILLVYTLSELGGLGGRELGGYAALCLLLLGALIGSALTADLFNLFVWFEVAALASYGLTGFFLERPIALEAAFKILVLTTVASFGVFVGTGMLYARHGALNLGILHDSLGVATGVADLVALALLIGGYATKAGLVPFHTWLPDAHTAAPGPVSALFSGLMVNLGIVVLARLGYQVFPSSQVPIMGLLMVLGLVSALVGAALALRQDDLKRLLSYDTVSQMGVITVGLASGTASGAAGGVYHLLNHALFKSLLFLCAGAIVHRTGLTNLSDMGGLARRMPVVAVAFLVGVASIAGVPPLNGYASLSLIHHGLETTHQTIPAVLLAVAQAVTVAALARAAWLAFFARKDPPEFTERPRPGMVTGFLSLAACCVALGVLSRPVVEHAMKPAAGALVHGDLYASAARGKVTPIPAPDVTLHYLAPSSLLLTLGCLLAGLVLARVSGRVVDAPPLRRLAALHNGSVNDYAALAAAGTLAVALAVLT